MANDKKCCTFGYPEIGAVLYGILSCIITALGELSCIGLLIYVVILIVDASSEQPTTSFALKTLYLYSGILVILAILCAIAFSFCVVLVKGVCRRSYNSVKAYFVFGLVEMLLLIAGSAIYLGLTLDFLVGGIALGSSVIYSLPLVFVWLTYRRLASPPPYQPCDREPVDDA